MTTFIDEADEPEFLRMLETLSVPTVNVQKLDPPLPRSVEDLGILEGDEDAIDDAKRSLETILALSRHEPSDAGDDVLSD